MHDFFERQTEVLAPINSARLFRQRRQLDEIDTRLLRQKLYIRSAGRQQERGVGPKPADAFADRQRSPKMADPDTVVTVGHDPRRDGLLSRAFRLYDRRHNHLLGGLPGAVDETGFSFLPFE